MPAVWLGNSISTLVCNCCGLPNDSTRAGLPLIAVVAGSDSLPLLTPTPRYHVSKLKDTALDVHCGAVPPSGVAKIIEQVRRAAGSRGSSRDADVVGGRPS